MADREKIISDFEKCLDDSVAAVVPADTVREVIALLRAQEPRVMTIQEVARCSMCWLEDESALVPALFISMEKRANGEKCDVFLAVQPDNDDCEFWYNIDEYGVTWRCWTSRPTEEQREAVKWG